MRYSIVFAGALAMGANASPQYFDRRYYVTEVDVVTDMVTVTAGQAAATPAVQAAGNPLGDLVGQIAAVPTQTWDFWQWAGLGNAGGLIQGWGAKTSSAPPAYTPPPPPPATTYAPPPPVTTYAAPPPPAYTPPPAAKPTYKPKPKPSPKPYNGGGGSYIAPNPGSGGGKPSYSDIVVMHHNLHRQNNSAPPVTWSQSLADTATRIAAGCNYAHNVQMDGGGYGQNIAAGAPPENISSIITDHMYNDEIGFFSDFYGQGTPGGDDFDTYFDSYGHYTQIVWKGTKQVGCATYDCTGHGNGPQGLGNVAANVPPYFTVCNYSPPGNYLGEFNDNVGEPLGGATENWSWGL